MDTLILYRGIAVPSADSAQIISNIKGIGLMGMEGKWKFVVPEVARVRSDIDTLFARTGITRNDVLGDTSQPGLCACGEASGAEYYAAKHNFSTSKDDCPLVIEFTSAIDRVYVDPRDFLCTAFQFWDRYHTDLRIKQSLTLIELFGPAIIRYFDAACQTHDQTYRITLCDLAAFDIDVVRAHHLNRKVIRGRHQTTFSSAFFVQGPVAPSQVKRIYPVESFETRAPDVILAQFLGDEGAYR